MHDAAGLESDGNGPKAVRGGTRTYKGKARGTSLGGILKRVAMGTERTPDVIVVGGGAIGLVCALALAATGRRVVVLERGRTGAEATHAAAGMLSPIGESIGPNPLLWLGLDSLARWKEFAAELATESGVDVDLRFDGKLLVARDLASAQSLRRREAWISEAGLDTEWLEAPELALREPAVEGAVAGLFLPQEGQVDNRALARALRIVVEQSGCCIREGSPVAEVDVVGGHARGVRLLDGTRLACDVVILAAGAWSGHVAGLPRPLPVRPVKGQMLALETVAAEPLVRSVVETESCYVVPRGPDPDGPTLGVRAWVGATSEEVGFTRGTTSEALKILRTAAAKIVPSLAQARVVDAWAGFRPGTPDGCPVLGRDPDVEGLVHATGHYRNGILLVPITAHLCRCAVEGHGDARLHSFRPDRFGS